MEVISDPCAISANDQSVKNKFRLPWMQQKVDLTIKIGGVSRDVEENVGDFLQKVSMPGKAQCRYCNDLINYGSRGLPSIKDHARSDKHKKGLSLRLSNYSLSGFI